MNSGSCCHIAYESCDGFVDAYEQDELDRHNPWEEMSHHKIPDYSKLSTSQRIRQESSLQLGEDFDD